MKFLGLLLLATQLAAQPLLHNDVVWGEDAALSLTNNFCTTNDIIIQNFGKALPYGSYLPVSGLSGGPLTAVTVTLIDLYHSFPSDMEIVLVSPNALAVKLLGYVGGNTSLPPTTLIFDDLAATNVPTPIVAGTWQPTDANPTWVFAADAGLPLGPYPTTLATFAGMDVTNANGNWRVFVEDSTDLDAGGITNVCLQLSQ